MIDHHNDMLQVLSVLLHYPDEDLIDSLDEIESLTANLRPSETQLAIQAFVRDFKSHAPLQLQERYTAVFDMNPAATMNLTYHMHGDNEKRAAALARLQHNYDQAGWERITGELPDYLPMMLEFLAVCHQPELTGAVWQCLQEMGPLVSRLEKCAPVYAALLRPIADMAIERQASADRGDHPQSARQ